MTPRAHRPSRNDPARTPAQASPRQLVHHHPYGDGSPALSLPRHRFPALESDPRRVHDALQDELMLDEVDRTNLASFCATWVESGTTDLTRLSLDRNAIGRGESSRTAELESRCVAMLADLWHAPAGPAVGTSTNGSNGAAMLAGLAARFRWRARRHAAGQRSDSPNLVCGSAQACWATFTRYFDVELRQAPMTTPTFALTPQQVVDRCDENTIAVVVTLGQTFTGLYEDVAAISARLDQLQAETGLDVDIHVDAASGGLLAPFVEPDLLWDFRLPRVKSVNASGHKMGLSPLGCGWAVWRDRESLPEELALAVNPVGGSLSSYDGSFSRSDGQIVAQYYAFVRLGREGYHRVHAAAYATLRQLAGAIGAMGPFELVFDGRPEAGITAVTWRLRADADVSFSLFDLAEKLRARGWLAPAYALPADLQALVVQRITVRRGFSRQMADLLLQDMDRAVVALTAASPSATVERGSSDPTPARP